MPFVKVLMSSGRSGEVKAAIAQAITSVMTDKAGCAPHTVSVVFEDVESCDWAIAGKLLSDQASNAPSLQAGKMR